MTEGHVTALIVAAGKGERLGADLPKQYRVIGGRPVLRWAVDALAEHPLIDQVRVVIGVGQQELAHAALDGLDVGEFVVGGSERSDSVLNGLQAIEHGTVLVHDAARPFCPPGVVDRLLAALEHSDGAVPVLPVADTLALGSNVLEEPVDRTRLLRVQTPQAFHVEDLIYAYEEAGRKAATDESTVMLAAGLKVATVDGDPMLEKLTTPADWSRAEAILSSRLVPRTGMGFDGPDRQLPTQPAACLGPHRLERQCQKARGDLLAACHHHIVFGRIVECVGFAAEVDKPIGFARHGADDDCNLVAARRLLTHDIGDAPNAFGPCHGGAAEFHHDAGQAGISPYWNAWDMAASHGA